MSDQTTLSDDELARDDPDLCEHGWSRLHPQSCPECEDESSSAKTTDRHLRLAKVEEYLDKALYTFIADPPDSDFQRGYREALRETYRVLLGRQV